MASCVFPGSFDPVTRGHLDLISRAAAVFDHVTVTVMINISKKGAFSAEERVSMLKRICASFPNVEVDSWSGLLADYMQQKGERTVLRGLRSSDEFDHEYVSFCANRMLNQGIDTVFIPCDPALNGVSSSAVREIAAFGGDIRSFVPEELTEEIRKHLSKKQS